MNKTTDGTIDRMYIPQDLNEVESLSRSLRCLQSKVINTDLLSPKQVVEELCTILKAKDLLRKLNVVRMRDNQKELLTYVLALNAQQIISNKGDLLSPDQQGIELERNIRDRTLLYR